MTLAFVERAVGAYLFEEAYDEGGLPESVCLHALWDAVLFTFGVATGQSPLGVALRPPAGASAVSPPILVPLASGTL